jgi:hypothetical protein
VAVVEVAEVAEAEVAEAEVAEVEVAEAEAVVAEAEAVVAEAVVAEVAAVGRSFRSGGRPDRCYLDRSRTLCLARPSSGTRRRRRPGSARQLPSRTARFGR